MGLINSLAGKKIFLDTAPLIYFIEEHPYYAPLLSELFISERIPFCRFVSSVITLTEVLVLPLREGKNDLAQKYEAILINSQSIDILGINIETAKITAQLRAKYSLKTPDAIQIATAIYCSADYFLTNDKRLKSIKEIKIITLEDLQ
jgi:predicted nucleic acid-binding protein